MTGALVTGAAGGLGLEIARVLAARGLAVHVTDLDREAAEAAASGLGPGAWGSALDVGDAEACRSAAAGTAERAGSLEVWVNNAGVLLTGPVWEQQPAEAELLFRVNALGTINGTLAALGPMRAAGKGHVVNIVSLAGLVAAPGEVLYSATKHAALAYTLGTAMDLRRSGIKGIRLSAVCPDGIWTPMLEDKLDDPEAAGSFSGQFQTPQAVAARVGELLDRPRAVIAVPRWRGWQVRMLDALPGLGTRMIPLFMADARRRQQRWKRRIESGEWPPAGG